MCGGVRISIGMGLCWIEEEKWNLEVWRSGDVKREEGSYVLCGHRCGSGVLLTSREGDHVSFVMGTQRFCY